MCDGRINRNGTVKEILQLTVTPCWKLPFATKDFDKVWQCHWRIRYKKKSAIGKLKNLTMVYKWRNIKGQVAHHSRGTWGLEGDNGLGATNLMSKSMYLTMMAVNPIYAHHLTETNGLFPYVYHMSGELWQAQMVQGRCPSDGPVYLCKTDMVSSPIWRVQRGTSEFAKSREGILRQPILLQALRWYLGGMHSFNNR